ncbi:YkgJ family cysteine cluster protein [Campylobacter sp. US33a]|uniref:YkgJ family cysteine cluster protein n=1 Tax=Campylobacter sp. US33a TaxID=2498120 RepID=UPI0010688544|nr:YkgJ family cysteine cluster protein [Campylobacter sp. US33a]TEY03524.1 YkgJ family cysteine cluster protein [Campylobacter sp. US33a]
MIYKQGFDFSFDENACEKCGGKCCIGESGNIFANKDELEAIAKFLNLNFEDFEQGFLRKVGLKYSFQEVRFEEGFACIFFDQNRRKCSIYELRPSQCRTFPFWEYFKKNKKELQKECIGVCF